jgi:hypothetical protein
MVKLLQYIGAGFMAFCLYKGIFEVAGAFAHRGSPPFVLIALALTPTSLMALVGIATAPNLSTALKLKTRAARREDDNETKSGE